MICCDSLKLLPRIFHLKNTILPNIVNIRTAVTCLLCALAAQHSTTHESSSPMSERGIPNFKALLEEEVKKKEERRQQNTKAKHQKYHQKNKDKRNKKRSSRRRIGKMTESNGSMVKAFEAWQSKRFEREQDRAAGRENLQTALIQHGQTLAKHQTNLEKEEEHSRKMDECDYNIFKEVFFSNNSTVQAKDFVTGDGPNTPIMSPARHDKPIIKAEQLAFMPNGNLVILAMKKDKGSTETGHLFVETDDRLIKLKCPFPEGDVLAISSNVEHVFARTGDGHVYSWDGVGSDWTKITEEISLSSMATFGAGCFGMEDGREDWTFLFPCGKSTVVARHALDHGKTLEMDGSGSYVSFLGVAADNGDGAASSDSVEEDSKPPAVN